VCRDVTVPTFDKIDIEAVEADAGTDNSVRGTSDADAYFFCVEAETIAALETARQYAGKSRMVHT
jgi:hypothetical protein